MPLWLMAIMDAGWKVNYLGLDVVKPAITANRKNIRIEHPNLVSFEFQHADIAEVPLAKADLIICKELVNHLVFADIFKVLRNFSNSKSRYVCVTSNKGWDNRELEVTSPGASRHIDLLRPPFSLKAPVYEDGFLAVWKNPLLK